MKVYRNLTINIGTSDLMYVSITYINLRISYYLHSERRKFISQKPIGEKYLNNDINKIEAFT